MNSAQETIHKNLLHFFTLKMNYWEEKLKKQFHSKLYPKKKKNLGINFTKEMKYLYTKNYKTLTKKVEDDSKKWKDIHALGLEELILLKWP